MDIRFSVEEKNRVRRNLEGFRPLTVSKCKAESADFFKLIMSFPNPKPRNIEKDVKVFPWKTLPYALKKIVTKYTASSYNNSSSSSSSSAQHQRRAQLKSANATPTATPSVSTSNTNPTSYMNVHQQETGMSNFYSNPQSNIYQQAPQTSSPFAYQPSQPQQQQQQQEPISSMYQSSPSSVPAFTTSSYTQSSPVIDSKNTPSPRMQYPYNDVLNSSSSAADDLAGMSAKVTPSSASNQGSPSLDSRSSLDNQQDYLVNFKNQ